MNDDNKYDDPEVGTKRMRSSTACAFEFRKHCLFCPYVTTCKLSHEYDDKVPHQYRIPASLVTTDKMAHAKTTYKEYLLDICQKRGDDLGKTVSARIHGAPSDLHAADAKYHSKCNQSCHRDAHGHNETGDKYSADDCAFSETVNVLSIDRSKVWNSLAVEAIYTDNGGCIMSRCALVEKVMQHFGDEVLSLYSPGMATLMVFRKHVPTNLKLVDDDDNDFHG